MKTEQKWPTIRSACYEVAANGTYVAVLGGKARVFRDVDGTCVFQESRRTSLADLGWLDEHTLVVKDADARYMVYDMETQACLQRIRPPHVPEGQTGPFALMNRNTVLDVLEIEMFKETYLYEINVANKNIRRTRLEEGIRTVYCIWSNEDRNTIGMTFLGGKEDKISGDTVYMELDADTFAEKKRVILDLDEPRSIRQNRYILDCKLRIYDLEEEKVVTQYDATLAEVDDPTKRYLYRVDFMNAHYIAIVFSDFIRILNMDTGKVANEYVYPYTSYARLDNEQKNIWIGTWEKIQILPFIDKSQI